MPESPSGGPRVKAARGPCPTLESSDLDHDRADPPARPETAPGSVELPATFGKYFLTEKLATGGMAEIYLAKIVGPGGFEKQLVIKQIHPRLSCVAGC
jgi:hypothetical protein